MTSKTLRTLLLVSSLTMMGSISWAEDVEPTGSELNKDESTIEERLSEADLVLSVRIEVALEQINMALSSRGRFFSEGVRYGANISEVWKGDYPDLEALLYFNVPLSACYRTLEKNTDYLLMVRAPKKGEIQVQSCQDIARRDEVAENIAALYQH